MTNPALQAVVDAARSLLLVGGASVNTAHCETVIERGRARGIVPAPDDVLAKRFAPAVAEARS